jgi:hypothetical protein
MKKILIAIPTNKYIEPQTMKAIYDLETPIGYKVDFQYFYGYQVDQIRNLIAHWAIHYDYLFSVDSDIVFAKDTLKKLLAHDKDMVSGIYRQRKEDVHVIEVYEYNENGGCTNIPYEKIKNTPLVELAACGMGCVLIKSEVFRTIGYPQYVYHSALDHRHTLSEDVDFCRKAKAKGFGIFADTTILCDHIGNKTFRVTDVVVDKTIDTISGDSHEYNFLEEAVQLLKKPTGVSVEIGVRLGLGSKLIIDSYRKYHPQVSLTHLGIDPYGNIFYAASDEVPQTKFNYDNNMKKETLINFAKNYPEFHLVCLEDTEFFKRYGDGYPVYNEVKKLITKYDCVHFDGPHDTKSIMEEIEFFVLRKAKECVFIFDDILGCDMVKIGDYLNLNGFKEIKKGNNKAIYYCET